MPRQVFTAGEILTAANMNDLSDQTVMVFDDSAARGSAIPTPAEGMVTYLKDTNLVEAYTGAAFEAVSQPGILQVVSTTKTDTFTTTSTSLVDITSFSVTITPSSASSKVLVFANMAGGSTNIAAIDYVLLRDSTSLFLGDSAGSRFRATKRSFNGTDNTENTTAIQFLDSPATTSAVTYKIQMRSNSGNTVAFNRSTGDSDAGSTTRSASSITVMEVAA